MLGFSALMVARDGTRLMKLFTDAQHVMNFLKFSFYTFIGSYPWSLGLAYGGFKLGENWEDLRRVMRPFDFPIAGIILVVVAWFIYHRIKVIRNEERR
mgnify:CR=1 FL=1